MGPRPCYDGVELRLFFCCLRGFSSRIWELSSTKTFLPMKQKEKKLSQDGGEKIELPLWDDEKKKIPCEPIILFFSDGSVGKKKVFPYRAFLSLSSVVGGGGRGRQGSVFV